MSYSNRIRVLYYDDAGQVSGADKTYTYTGGGQSKVSESIPGSSTNLALGFTLDVSALQSCLLLADRAMTIKTNSSGSPDATITLVGGVPKVWSSDVGGSNPFGSVDVTSLFVTLAAGAASPLTIVVLTDPTP